MPLACALSRPCSSPVRHKVHGIIITPKLEGGEVRELWGGETCETREVMPFTQGHRAKQGESRDLNADLLIPELPLGPSPSSWSLSAH